MTNKIEDFETGEKENKKIIFVDLSTSENLEKDRKSTRLNSSHQ